MFLQTPTNPEDTRVFIASDPYQHLVTSVILILANVVIFPWDSDH